MNCQNHPLSPLFAPRSIAIVGASANLDSLTGRTVKALQHFGYDGTIYPVNPKYNIVGGLPCYKDLAHIPTSADVALISVKAHLVPSILRTCIEKDIHHVIIYSSGFAEAGDGSLQKEMMDVARKGSIRILGPNCQGLLNLSEGIPLTFSGALYNAEPPAPGHVAFVSQSGAFGFSSFGVGLDHGVRYRYVVTTGNQADIDAVECAGYVITDPEVRLLMMYLEGIENGERFLELVREARERDIAIAVLKAGRSPSAQEAARSHTAALTGDDAVWNAIFAQYGVIPLKDMDDIIGIGQLFGASPRTAGDRAAILTTSGGAGIVMADCLSDLKMKVPEFSSQARQEIEKAIPSFGASRNPVDMTVQISEKPENFRHVLNAALHDPNIDMVITALSMIVGDAGALMADELVKSYQNTNKPQAAVWMIDNDHGGAFVERLKTSGFPIFQSFRQCARALKALRNWENRLPFPITKVAYRDPILRSFPPKLTEYDAKRLLDRYRIPITKERLCRDMEEAFDAAEEFGFPVALKGMSAEILHKTEADIVTLDIRSFDEMRHALKRTRENLKKHVSDHEIQGFLVQEMVKGGMECIVGVKRDPVFGPIVAVGLGGIYVEVLSDVSLRHAPVDEKEALCMIKKLKGYGFLSGARGQRHRDVEALAKIVSKVSQLACIEEDLLELDINPVFVMPEGEGAIAADALVIRRNGY
ncbi:MULTISPECIES: acetate--CoA ligase family protein [Aminobacterium]|jgi:acyl-CoA synthetase (NDP forming)|uniref:acetate--CoA ligase family protein n=1 Tax=Aminobacterium TaxID=81466 RepID=UPI00257BD363|nr:acetate--CoA ligase family protein [Aminobacterium sp. UBA4834]